MFELCLFLVVFSVIGGFWCIVKSIVCDPTLDALKVPRVCGVCGVNTMGSLCSECCTWAEVQAVECEKRMAWADKWHPIGFQPDIIVKDNEAEHYRLVKAAGW